MRILAILLVAMVVTVVLSYMVRDTTIQANSNPVMTGDVTDHRPAPVTTGLTNGVTGQAQTPGSTRTVETQGTPFGTGE